MLIRNEATSDVEVIDEITRTAFENHPYSKQTESFIVRALRAADALTVSLVAEIDGKAVGHVAFSPVTISGESENWYGAGPLSVLPAFQRKGVGKALFLEGLNRLRTIGAHGCVLVGDPGYYVQFGFKNPPELVLDGVPPQYLLALPQEEPMPRGVVTFHDAFKADR